VDKYVDSHAHAKNVKESKHFFNFQMTLSIVILALGALSSTKAVNVLSPQPYGLVHHDQPSVYSSGGFVPSANYQ
jgi:hypothetical protein